MVRNKVKEYANMKEMFTTRDTSKITKDMV